MRLEGRFDWRFSQRKLLEVNICIVSQNLVWRNRVHACAQWFKCLWCVYRKSVWAFQVSASLSRSSSQRCFERMHMQMHLWCTYWTRVGVQWGSASLVQNPACLMGPLSDPLFELVRFCRIVKGRPKFRSRICICQKVFSRPVKWLKKLCWWNRKQSRKIFKNWNLIFKKVYFSNLNQQMSMLKSRFSLKNSKICIYYLKILKICSYIHLFKKWSKHAFSYASMQMHNYPKPRRLDIMLFKK